MPKIYSDTERGIISEKFNIKTQTREKLAGSTISFSTEKVMGLTLQQHIAVFPNQNPPHYIFYIETKEDRTINLADLAKQIDIEQQNDLRYKHKRRDGLLKFPKVCIMHKSWMESPYREKESIGINRAQLKLPIILKEKI